MLPAQHQTRRRGDDGFTLIELLVVVIILGVLAAIVVPAYTRQQDKAAIASTKSNYRNLVPVLMTARDNRKQTLRLITGSNCSACACNGVPLLPVKDPAFTATTCGTQWLNTVTRIAAASGESEASMRALLTDGWGYPILMDENEGENTTWAACEVGQDMFVTGGPDHLWPSGPAGSDLHYWPPVNGCHF